VLADNNVPAPDPLKSPCNGTPGAAGGAGGGADAVASRSRPTARSTIAVTTPTKAPARITHFRKRRRPSASLALGSAPALLAWRWVTFAKASAAVWEVHEGTSWTASRVLNIRC